jgi:5-(carboxyamino)imidazole ribonucleotide synthase
VSPIVAERARAIARAIADEVRLVGTLTVECFVTGDDVFVNELAPRVHNSGHLTIEACGVSQFEQHVRAVCGLPLAEPVLRAPAAMANILGDAAGALPVRGCEVGLATAETHLHLYGKAEVRVRRKMGHVTALGDTLEIAVERATRAAEAVRWG